MAYTPHKWSDGELITAERLNALKMEQQNRDQQARKEIKAIPERREQRAIKGILEQQARKAIKVISEQQDRREIREQREQRDLPGRVLRAFR